MIELSFRNRYADFISSVRGQTLLGVYQTYTELLEDFDYDDFDEFYNDNIDASVIILQFENMQFTVTKGDEHLVINQSKTDLCATSNENFNSVDCVKKWVETDVLKRMVLDAVPCYDYFGEADGLTILFENANIAIRGFDMMIDHNVPAPKYILRKKYWDVFDKIEELLTKFHPGLKRFHSHYDYDYIKELRKIDTLYDVQIGKLLGAKQLNLSYNNCPNAEKVKNILEDICRNIRRIHIDTLKYFCDIICKDDVSCRYCPIAASCNKHHLPQLT